MFANSNLLWSGEPYAIHPKCEKTDQNRYRRKAHVGQEAHTTHVKRHPIRQALELDGIEWVAANRSAISRPQLTTVNLELEDDRHG